MARKKSVKTETPVDVVVAADGEGVEDVEDLDEAENLDVDIEEINELEVDDDVEALETAVDDELDDDDEDDAAEDGDGPDTALDELEAEELEMLTEDEADEVIAVDEAAEVRSIRRAELALDKEADAVSSDEFVCASCFLVKRTSQLANKRKKICRDCAA